MHMVLIILMICICLINFKIVSLKQRETQELKKDISVITTNNDYFLKENNRLKHEVSGLELSINNAAELVEKLNEKIESYEEKYQNLFKKCNKSRAKNEKATKLIAQLKKELKEEQKKRARAEKQKFDMQLLFEPITERNRSLELIIDSYMKDRGEKYAR